jgi:hypothetical protein
MGELGELDIVASGVAAHFKQFGPSARRRELVSFEWIEAETPGITVDCVRPSRIYQIVAPKQMHLLSGHSGIESYFNVGFQPRGFAP